MRNKWHMASNHRQLDSVHDIDGITAPQYKINNDSLIHWIKFMHTVISVLLLYLLVCGNFCTRDVDAVTCCNRTAWKAATGSWLQSVQSCLHPSTAPLLLGNEAVNGSMSTSMGSRCAVWLYGLWGTRRASFLSSPQAPTWYFNGRRVEVGRTDWRSFIFYDGGREERKEEWPGRGG